jgi:hypothetical protein
MSTIELSNGSATLTARADYLLVVEHGTLSTADEVLRYVTELEMAGQRFHLRRLLVDARSEIDGAESRGEASGAMWRWIRSQRVFDLIGYVLRDEMTIARVNMTALSERLPVRAFGAVADGHRWLARARPSSTALTAVRPVPSSMPPPPIRTPVPERTPMPPSQRARETAKHPTLSPQEADALLPPRSTLPPPSENARTTVKIAALDDKTAEEIRRKGSR